MTSLSTTPFLTAALMRQGTSLRQEIDRTSLEMTTGMAADTGAALRGDFSALAGIDHSLARISAFSAATSEAALLADAGQGALTILSDKADLVAVELVRELGTADGRELSAVIRVGADAFSTAVSAVNTQVSGRSVFGGVDAATAPLPDAETLLAALEPVVAGATTAEAAMAAITGWFQSATGLGAEYRGGPARAAIPVAEGETARFGFTALDPAITSTLAGLATVALLDRGLLAADGAARAELAGLAGESLLSSADDRAELQSEVGVVQARVAAAVSRNAAEKTALGLARLSLVEADPYETAVRLQDLQSRLDAFYTITTRLASLSLTEYL